jgi:hypothetical protein
MSDFDSDISRAVLDALWPLPRVLPGPWEIDRNELDQADRGCIELRKWVNRQHLSPELREAYLHWVDFAESDNRRARIELETGTQRGEFEARQAEVDAKLKRAHALSEDLPRPPREFSKNGEINES